MNEIINIYKPIGLTPLQVISQLRKQRYELKEVKIACAGRLDPMAEGVLLLISGNELKRFDEYCSFDKEYEADILFGFETDSYDVLGKVHKVQKVIKFEKDFLKEVINKYKGKISLPLPPYSSYQVNKKPLYWWARRNLLNNIKIPKREVEIYSITLRETYTINTNKLINLINNKINSVHGDFRQENILQQWNEVLTDHSISFQVIKLNIKCSSGTYIRSLAHELGKTLSTGGILLHLIRSRVGDFNIEQSIKL